MLKKNLNICFVTEDFYPNFIGGQGIYGWKLVSQLTKIGHSVTILAENRGGRKEFWEDLPAGRQGKKNIVLVLVPFVFGNQLLLALLEYVYFLFRFRNTYFDIVHANQLSGLFFVLFRPKNIGKIIISVHNTNYDMAKKTESLVKKILYQPLIFLERILYQRADGLLFNSPDEKKEMFNYYTMKDKPTKAVYLGVDSPLFTMQEQQKARLQVRKDLNVSVDTKIVLYAGRLVKRKKVDVLIKSLALLNDRNVVGVIIGEGVDRERLEKMAKNNVCFLGFVEDTKPYFLAADVFVTVSVAEGGFSLAVLEAASFSLPLIISPSVAGFPIVQKEVNGYIVDADNPHILSEKIQLALKKSKEMGRKSSLIAKQFTWSRCAGQTKDFYQAVLGFRK